MKRYFISFASPKMKLALDKIIKQSVKMNYFDEIIPYTIDNLSAKFVQRYSEKLDDNVRGFGYWSWKPEIIKQTLAQMNDGDQLLYLDAGCNLNRHGKKRLAQYFDMLSQDVPLVTFINDTEDTVFNDKNVKLPDWPLKNWIKGDLIDYFNIREQHTILDQQVFFAGILFLQKGKISENFIDQWEETIRTSWSFVDDSPSSSPNLKNFIEHRHDQAIFSVLCNLYPIHKISGCEVVYPKIKGRGGDWKKLKSFPIHARRDRRENFSTKMKGIRNDLYSFFSHITNLRS